MPRFVCDRCRQPLSLFLAKIKLPRKVHVDFTAFSGEIMPAGRIPPPRMPRGTYAANLHPCEYTCEPEGHVLHPEDVIGMAPNPDQSTRHGCCGPSGIDGLNLICIGCGMPVAAEQADCWGQNQVVMDFAATRRSFSED